MFSYFTAKKVDIESIPNAPLNVVPVAAPLNLFKPSTPVENSLITLTEQESSELAAKKKLYLPSYKVEAESSLNGTLQRSASNAARMAKMFGYANPVPAPALSAVVDDVVLAAAQVRAEQEKLEAISPPQVENVVQPSTIIQIPSNVTPVVAPVKRGWFGMGAPLPAGNNVEPSGPQKPDSVAAQKPPQPGPVVAAIVPKALDKHPDSAVKRGWFGAAKVEIVPEKPPVVPVVTIPESGSIIEAKAETPVKKGWFGNVVVAANNAESNKNAIAQVPQIAPIVAAEPPRQTEIQPVQVKRGWFSSNTAASAASAEPTADMNPAQAESTLVAAVSLAQPPVFKLDVEQPAPSVQSTGSNSETTTLTSRSPLKNRNDNTTLKIPSSTFDDSTRPLFKNEEEIAMTETSEQDLQNALNVLSSKQTLSEAIAQKRTKTPNDINELEALLEEKSSPRSLPSKEKGQNISFAQTLLPTSDKSDMVVQVPVMLGNPQLILPERMLLALPEAPVAQLMSQPQESVLPPRSSIVQSPVVSPAQPSVVSDNIAVPAEPPSPVLFMKVPETQTPKVQQIITPALETPTRAPPVSSPKAEEKPQAAPVKRSIFGGLFASKSTPQTETVIDDAGIKVAPPQLSNPFGNGNMADQNTPTQTIRGMATPRLRTSNLSIDSGYEPSPRSYYPRSSVSSSSAFSVSRSSISGGSITRYSSPIEPPSGPGALVESRIILIRRQSEQMAQQREKMELERMKMLEEERLYEEKEKKLADEEQQMAQFVKIVKQEQEAERLNDDIKREREEEERRKLAVEAAIIEAARMEAERIAEEARRLAEEKRRLEEENARRAIEEKQKREERERARIEAMRLAGEKRKQDEEEKARVDAERLALEKKRQEEEENRRLETQRLIDEKIIQREAEAHKLQEKYEFEEAERRRAMDLEDTRYAEEEANRLNALMFKSAADVVEDEYSEYEDDQGEESDYEDEIASNMGDERPITGNAVVDREFEETERTNDLKEQREKELEFQRQKEEQELEEQERKEREREERIRKRKEKEAQIMRAEEEEQQRLEQEELTRQREVEAEREAAERQRIEEEEEARENKERLARMAQRREKEERLRLEEEENLTSRREVDVKIERQQRFQQQQQIQMQRRQQQDQQRQAEPEDDEEESEEEEEEEEAITPEQKMAKAKRDIEKAFANMAREKADLSGKGPPAPKTANAEAGKTPGRDMRNVGPKPQGQSERAAPRVAQMPRSNTTAAKPSAQLKPEMTRNATVSGRPVIKGGLPGGPRGGGLPGGPRPRRIPI